MTRWAELALALYAKFNTWRALAVVLDGPSWRPRGSYYHRIAKGLIRHPSPATRRKLRRLYLECRRNDVTGGYELLERTPRFPMVVTRPLGQSINEWRRGHALSWDQWAAKADALMRREFGE